MNIELGSFKVSMPDNGVSECGRDLIRMKLVQWDRLPLPNDWSWQWRVGGKGEYVGALPKRIGKYYHQEHNRKLTAQQLSEIGNIASSHSPKADTYFGTFQEAFDWERGEFGDPDSCYWTCHKSAKAMILGAGGLTMKLYKSDNRSNDNGLARCWIIPRMIQQQQCYIVANGYGIETLPLARILARYLGDAYYHKIWLMNKGDTEGDLWINGSGSGYLVGPQKAVLFVTEIDLEIGAVLVCIYCECDVSDDKLCHDPDGDICCAECYRERVDHCSNCDELMYTSRAFSDPGDDILCEACYDKLVTHCEGCNNDIFVIDAKNHLETIYCEECFDKKFTECERCIEIIPVGQTWCEDCAPEENELLSWPGIRRNTNRTVVAMPSYNAPPVGIPCAIRVSPLLIRSAS